MFRVKVREIFLSRRESSLREAEDTLIANYEELSKKGILELEDGRILCLHTKVPFPITRQNNIDMIKDLTELGEEIALFIEDNNIVGTIGYKLVQTADK